MATKNKESSIGALWAASESDESESDIQPSRKISQRKVNVAPKDSDEEELEHLVLGSKAAFREHLFKQTTLDGAGSSLQELNLEDAPQGQSTGLEDLDDSAFFFYDNTASLGREKGLVTIGKESEDQQPDANAPAWEDSDDDRLSISLASVGRLRKLRLTEVDDVVSGTEYTRRLRQQYLRLNPLPSWAAGADERQIKRRRRSSASSDSSAASDEDGDEEVASALPLEKFLRSASAMNLDASSKKKKLRPEVIDIQRTRDIPDSHSGPVGSLSFHPEYPVLLSSSTSSMLNLHHIAPTAHPTPNPLLTSIQVKRVPIRRSEFLAPGGQIVLAGRRKYFHTWDISTGRVNKITKVAGHKQEHKSMERFRLSPCGRYMAIIATDRKGGGMLNILTVNTMQWTAQARLESRGGIADFAWWSTGDGITILGRDGNVGEWSMEDKKFLGTWRDEGSIGATVMALGGRGGPTILGDDRWVAVGSNSGILNVYDRRDLLISSKDGEVEIKALPEPKRRLDQLITPITVISWTPDGNLMAFGSEHKRDAFKLVHLPSCTVYRNWPTEQTPLGRITAVAFGKESNILAVGNDRGKIRMWEIRS